MKKRGIGKLGVEGAPDKSCSLWDTGMKRFLSVFIPPPPRHLFPFPGQQVLKCSTFNEVYRLAVQN